MKRWAGYLVAAGLVAATGAALWLGWPRPRLLMQRATRVRVPGGKLPTNTYFWLSDHEMLTLTEGVKALRVDTQTGMTAQLALLNDRLDSVPVDYLIHEVGGSLKQPPYRIAVPCSLAVNRRQMLCQAVDDSGGGWYMRATDLHGGPEPHARDVPEPSEAILLPVRNGWIGFWATGQHGMRARTFRLDGSAASPDIVVPGTDEFSQPLGLARGGSLLVVNPFAAGTNAVELLEATVSPKPRIVRRQVVRFEGEPLSVSAALSPDGRRIAWLVGLHIRAPTPAILRPLYARFGLRDRTFDEVCVSLADGTDMRLVGFKLRDAPTDDGEIGDVQWTPDGRRLSFLRDRAPYTVPAD